MLNLALTNVPPASVKDACAALSNAFANAVDSRNYPQVLEQFSENAVLQCWGQSFFGRKEIAAMLDARPINIQSRHICSNIEISQQSAYKATGVTYFIFSRRRRWRPGFTSR